MVNPPERDLAERIRNAVTKRAVLAGDVLGGPPWECDEFSNGERSLDACANLAVFEGIEPFERHGQLVRDDEGKSRR